MLNFQGSPGAVFNAFGKLGVLIKQAASCQAAQKTNYIDQTNGVVAQLVAQPDIQAVIGSSYINDLSGPETSCVTAQQVAQLYLNRLVFLDNPQPFQDMQSVNLSASINEMIRQMKIAGQTVLRMSIGTTVNGNFTNTNATPGNAVIVVSTKRPSDGAVLENSFAETIQVTCAADSYSGNQTAFNELFTVTGENSQGDVFAYNWPLGSGANTTTSAIDGGTSNGSGNLLTNSGFATFTSNTPNNWTITVGTAGTNIFKETSLIFTGAAALKITGDGSSTLTSLQQQFNNAAGTGGALTLQTQYGVNLWLRGGASPPAQGVLQVDLVDQNGTIINDEGGAPNSFTIDLTTLTSTYQPFNGAFRTPIVMPTSQYLRLHLTTSLPNGVSVYVGKVSLGSMTQLYTSGPFLSIHAGSIPSVQNDYTSVSITNSLGAGGTKSTFQVLCNQLFGLQPSDILIPSAAVPTISDNLIS